MSLGSDFKVILMNSRSKDHRKLLENDDNKYSFKNYLRHGSVHGLKYLGRKNKCEM